MTDNAKGAFRDDDTPLPINREEWVMKARMSPPGYSFVSATPQVATYSCDFCGQRVVAVDRHNDTCKERPSGGVSTIADLQEIIREQVVEIARLRAHIFEVHVKRSCSVCKELNDKLAPATIRPGGPGQQ